MRLITAHTWWLFVFLHQQRGGQPLLGDSEPAGNIAFDQSSDHHGGDCRARDDRPLPVSTGGHAEQQEARGDAERFGLRRRNALKSSQNGLLQVAD
jgi:hypothetical protein